MNWELRTRDVIVFESRSVAAVCCSGMAWLRVIWTVSFFAAPIAAGVLGYNYQGWLGVVLFPIVAVIAVMAAMMGVVIFLASLKYRSDRARVSRLSAEQLQALLETPTNPDFRFAFFELSKRGLDVSPARQLLLEMLTSNVAKERNTALERLWEIYPAVRHRFEIGPTDDPPKEVRAQVEAILTVSNAATVKAT